MNTNYKENLAQNLTKYRKASNLTQLELAEKLNYSDKAISKWERGESAPDIFVLKQLADFYGTKVDTLLSEPKPERVKLSLATSKKRSLICLIASGLVWLVAILSFAFLGIIVESIENTWLSFIVAIPVTSIVLLVFTGVWGKNLATMILLSIFIWTFMLAVFLCLLCALPVVPKNLWQLFLICIPLQVIIVFWFLYKRIK